MQLNFPGNPLLRAWVKSRANPVVNDTQRDPSGAWRTAHGEWRLTTFDAMLYASNATNGAGGWGAVGTQPGWSNTSEFPSLFPLPARTPGTGPTSQHELAACAVACPY